MSFDTNVYIKGLDFNGEAWIFSWNSDLPTVWLKYSSKKRHFPVIDHRMENMIDRVVKKGDF
jgi:hypothetical protein